MTATIVVGAAVGLGIWLALDDSDPFEGIEDQAVVLPLVASYS